MYIHIYIYIYTCIYDRRDEKACEQLCSFTVRSILDNRSMTWQLSSPVVTNKRLGREVDRGLILNVSIKAHVCLAYLLGTAPTKQTVPGYMVWHLSATTNITTQQQQQQR